MKQTIILGLAALIFSTPSFAHVKLGTYQGKDLAGADCSFNVLSVTFENSVRNPFNERVTIAVNQDQWVLSHAPSIDTDAVTLNFDHGRLSAVKGVKGGATGMVLTMDHSEGHDGPSHLTFVSEVRTAGQEESAKVKTVCAGLNHVE